VLRVHSIGGKQKMFLRVKHSKKQGGLTRRCLRSAYRAMRQYMVQNDRQAQPTDSGTAAARPTLLYAFGSVSMIWPICKAAARQ
jgi:hypothetical protein